ncbi:MAG TPA: M4 family metallopeptidase [Gammaproteobacteria bacterium]
MRLITLALGALLAFPAAATAASHPGLPGTPNARMTEAQRAVLERMLNDPRNHGMEVRLSRGTGIPAFMRSGDEPLAQARTPEQEQQAAIDFIDMHAELFLLNNPKRELALEKAHADARGGHNYRYQQYVEDVPVRGAELLAHFNAGGEMYALTANTVPSPIEIGTTPGITLENAAYIARVRFTSADVTQEAALEIHRIDEDWRLVYAVESMVNGFNRWMTVIDAESGEVLSHHLDHRTNSVSASGVDLAGATRRFTVWQEDGLYYLVDATTPVQSNREDPLSSSDSWGDLRVIDLLNTEGESRQDISSSAAHDGWDPAGVSAMANSHAAYRYFLEQHSRASIDGENSAVLSAVHYGNDYDNAFWNGTTMVFGDGGRRFTSFAECLDVVAHEMTHGVIDHSADLVYENQSGALNESFADVFGALADDDDWIIGEGCVKLAPGYMRSLRDPNASRNWQPAHMADYVDKPNTEDGDWGGVHVNSGIPNRAAYLLMEGLEEENLGESIGRAAGGRLYYHALTSYLLSNAEFIDLRRAMLLSADYLYPKDPDVRAAVAAAFDAVGIVEGNINDGGLDKEPRLAGGEVSASARRLDFGDAEAGDRKTLALVLSNDTDEYVVVHQFVLEGAAFSHDFGYAQLAPGDAIEGRVSFTGPDATGSYAGRLEIITSGVNSPLVIDLAATVIAKPVAPEGSPSASGGGALDPLLAFLLVILPAVAGLRRLSRDAA